MTPLHDFDFHAPATVDEALRLLEKLGGGAKILAGGTDLVVSMKHGLSRPRHLVWPGRIAELSDVVGKPDGSVTIGAMCRLAGIANHPLVLAGFPKVAEAARGIASPQIRNSATVGGNLCINTRCFYYDHSEFWRGALCGCLKLRTDNGGVPAVCHAGPGLGVCAAVFFSDLAPVLIALDATVDVRSRAGSRTLPLSSIYAADGAAHLLLQPGEMIVAINVPAPGARARVSRMKMGARGAIDFPVANVAAVLGFDGSGTCVSGKIVIGAVEPTPVELKAGVEMLLGHRPDGERIALVARQAAAAVTPFPNAYESAGYRKKMVEVLVRRCLGEIAA